MKVVLKWMPKSGSRKNTRQNSKRPLDKGHDKFALRFSLNKKCAAYNRPEAPFSRLQLESLSNPPGSHNMYSSRKASPSRQTRFFL